MLHLSLQNWTHFTSMVIAYQNKKHTFNWLNTRHVTFTIPWWLGCWCWPVQKPRIDWCWSISWYKIAVPIRFRFLDSLKNFCALYCVCQILVFNAINTSYWYGGQYQDRETALGSWYRPWNWYFPRLWQYYVYWYQTLGQSVCPDIAIHISNYYITKYFYFVFYHIDCH